MIEHNEKAPRKGRRTSTPSSSSSISKEMPPVGSLATSSESERLYSDSDTLNSEPIKPISDIAVPQMTSEAQPAKRIFGFTIDIEETQARSFGDDILDTLKLVQQVAVPRWLIAVITEFGPLTSAAMALVNRKFSGFLRLLLVAGRVAIKSIFPSKILNNNNQH